MESTQTPKPSTNSGAVVRMFGGPAVEVDGQDIRLTAYQKYILALVYADSPDGIPRSRAAEIIWDEPVDRRHRRRLSQIVYRLNKQAGQEIIGGNEEWLRRGEGVEVLEEVGEVGAFLRRIESGSSKAMEEWCEGKRGEAARELKGFWMRELLQAKSEGRTSDALLAIERLRDAGEASTELEEIANAAVTAALLGIGDERVSSSHPDFSHGTRRGLVGRDRELHRLLELVQQPAQGAATVVVLGPPGVGKTALLDAFETQTRGVEIVRAQTGPIGSVTPFGPWLDALEESISLELLEPIPEPWRSIGANLFSLLGATVTSDTDIGPSQPHRVFEALRRILEEVAQRHATAVLLDDFHHADASSVAAFEYVHRQWKGPPILFIACLRSRVNRQHPVPHSIVESADVVMGLDDLSEDAALELASVACGPNAPPALPKALVDIAGRNPLFLVELGREVRKGRIELDSVKSLELTLPQSVDGLVVQRAALLDESARWLLDFLAVLSKPVRISDLTGTFGLQLWAAMKAIGALADSGFVRMKDAEVLVTHPVVTTAVLRRIDPAKRVVLHQLAAEHLERTNADPATLLPHIEQAGRARSAYATANEALDAAARRGALPEAIAFARLAARNASAEVERADASARLGRLLHRTEAHDEAVNVLELAAVQLESVGRHPEALNAALLRLDALTQASQTSPHSLLAQLREVREKAMHLSELEAAAEAIDIEVRLLVRHERFEEATKLLRLAGDLTVGKGARAACALKLVQFRGRYLPERVDHITGHLTDAVALADDLDLASRRLLARLRLVCWLFQTGEFTNPENQNYLAEALEMARESGDPTALRRLHSNAAAWFIDVGDSARALSQLELAESVQSGTIAAHQRLILLVNRGELLIQTGDWEEALTAFQLANDLWETVEHPQAGWMILPGLGLTALEHGDVRTARWCEEQLGPNPEALSFDPTLLALFRARMARLRSRPKEAVAELAWFVQATSYVMPPVCVKLTVQLARHVSGTPRGFEAELIDTGIESARALGLKERLAELLAVVSNRI